MKRVVSTSWEVRFVETTDSKKKGLKKLVAYTIARIRSEGRYVVKSSLIILRFKLIFMLIPSEGSPKIKT